MMESIIVIRGSRNFNVFFLQRILFKKPSGEGSQTSLKTTSPQIENCLLKLYLLNNTSTQLPSIILTTEMLNEPEVSNFPPTSLNPPQFSGLPWIQSNRSPLYGKQGARIQAGNTQKSQTIFSLWEIIGTIDNFTSNQQFFQPDSKKARIATILKLLETPLATNQWTVF